MNYLTMGDVVDAVCREFNVTTDDIFGRSRKRDAVHPRQAAMAMCIGLAGKSTTQTGKFLGGRDHTTVMHGRDAHRNRCQRDFEYREKSHRAFEALLDTATKRASQ